MHRLFFQGVRAGTLLFSRYRVQRCLSARDTRGIYLCSDTLGRNNSVVLKVLYRAHTGPEDASCDAIALLDQEARLSQRVSHPNVVSAHAFHQDEDFAAIVMDYAPLGTLTERLAEGCLRSVRESVNTVAQIGNALSAVHNAGILHRDVKPDNVLLFADGTIKVSDFGIATTMKRRATYHGRGMTGTFDYLSPEYLMDGIWTVQCDLYALGVILYQLITGQFPFPKAPIFEATETRVHKDPPEPSTHRPNLPLEIDTLCMRALARDPRDRFLSADDMLTALSRVPVPTGTLLNLRHHPVFTARTVAWNPES